MHVNTVYAMILHSTMFAVSKKCVVVKRMENAVTNIYL